MRGAAFLIAAACAVFAWAPPAAAGSSAAKPVESLAAAPAAALELSAQSRAQARRSPQRPRITVRPREPRDVRGMRRECVAAYEERFIPQWGGYVIHPGRRCWWVPG